MVEEGDITSRNTGDMPMRQCNTLDYNFTKQEKKYLTTENTCVIDNLIGIYGEELKLDRDGLIKLNKEFHGVMDDKEGFNEDNEFDFGLDDNVSNGIKIKKHDVDQQLFNLEKEFDILYHSYYIDEMNNLKYMIKNIDKSIDSKDYVISV